jgi:hypothetical protein
LRAQGRSLSYHIYQSDLNPALVGGHTPARTRNSTNTTLAVLPGMSAVRTAAIRNRLFLRPRASALSLPSSFTHRKLHNSQHRFYDSKPGGEMAMEAACRVKLALNEGRQTFGLWQMAPGANISRCLARAGADWVCVDCEHGNMDGEHLVYSWDCGCGG